MFLLAALLCNYGRGKCLIDIGTEGYADARRALEQLHKELDRINLDLPPFLTQPVSRNSTRNFRHGNKLQIQ